MKKINSPRIKLIVALVVISGILAGSMPSTEAQVATTMDVFQMGSTGSFWSAAGDKLYMAARIGAQTFNYYGATAWVAAGMTAASVASIAGTLAVAGVAAGTAALITYGTIKGLEWINGVLTKPGAGENTYQPTQSGLAVVGWPNYPNRVKHVFPDSASCWAAAGAYAASKGWTDWNTAINQGKAVYYRSSLGGWMGGYFTNYNDNTSNPGHYFLYCSVAGSVESIPPPREPVTPAALATMLETDLGSAVPATKEAAQNASKQLMESVAPGYNDWRNSFPPPPAALPGTLPAAPGSLSPPNVAPGVLPADLGALKDALNGAVSQAAKDAIAAQDIASNAGKNVIDPIINPPASNTGALSKADTAAAVKDGIDQAGAESPGPLTPPTGEVDPELPEKMNLTNVLDTFWEGLQSLPVISALNNLSLNASGGSPSISMNVPHIFSEGSTALELNFATDGVLGISYAGILALVGQMNLTFCGLYWTMYLFKSGE